MSESITDKWECLSTGGVFSEPSNCSKGSISNCILSNGYTQKQNCNKANTGDEHCKGPDNSRAVECGTKFLAITTFKTLVELKVNICLTKELCIEHGGVAKSESHSCAIPSDKYDCFQQGKQYLEATLDHKAYCTPSNGDIKPLAEECFSLGFQYKSSTENCVQKGVSGAQIPTENDCIIQGMKLSDGICILFDEITAEEKKIENCPIPSTIFFKMVSGRCFPQAEQKIGCLEYGLTIKLTDTNKCAIPTNESDCPIGFSLKNNLCIPDDEFSCLALGMQLINEKCVKIKTDQDCQNLNQRLKIDDNLEFCKFSDSNLEEKFKKQTCLSYGNIYIKETNSCQQSDCPPYFTELNSLCFPNINTTACENHILKFVDKDSFCQFPFTQETCKESKLQAIMKDPKKSWCIEQPPEYNYCDYPNEETCSQYSLYYDETDTINDYKCQEQCDSTYIQEKKCVLKCGNGYYASTDISDKQCKKCPDGCSKCVSSQNCIECEDNYVKIKDNNAQLSQCKQCADSFCKQCSETKIKCFKCKEINFVLEQGSDEKHQDHCRQCIQFCKTCQLNDYQTICDECYQNYTPIMTNDKITKCQCLLKTQNIAIRNKIQGTNETQELIQTLTTFEEFKNFYCEIVNNFKKQQGNDCHADDILLDESQDKEIMNKIILQLESLLDKGKNEFTKNSYSAYELLTKFLETELAQYNNVMNETNIKAALKLMGNANFTASTSNYINLLNNILNIQASFVPFQEEIQACFQKLNNDLFDKTSDINVFTNNLIVNQSQQTQNISNELLGIQFQTQPQEILEDHILGISRYILSKNSYEVSNSNNLWKSNRQYQYFFTEKYQNEENQTIIEPKIFNLSETDCFPVIFQLDEEIKLVNSNHTFYVGQYTKKKWDISNLIQSKTFDNQTHIEACITNFTQPFIIIEHENLSSSLYSQILILSLTIFQFILFLY